MYRVAMVGAQSHHASEFTRLINNEKVIDGKVTCIWAEEGQEERCRQIQKECNVDKICKTYEEMTKDVDVAFIATRNGNDHFEQVKPFIDANIPVWIDKPIALKIEDIVRICDYAQSHNAKLMGGTTLKNCESIKQFKRDVDNFESLDYISFTYCSSVDSPTGGISFYSIHLAEIAYMFCGCDIDSLRACVNGDTVNVLLNYKNGTVAGLIMTKGGYQVTGTAVYGSNNCIARVLDVLDSYTEEITHVIDVVEGKEKPLERDDFIEPVKIMQAIEKAIDADGALVKY